MAVIEIPELLLPKPNIDLHKWACIACDQFTSEIEYWNALQQLVDNVPSTYRLILPEAYLEMPFETRIKAINRDMDLYLRSNIFTGLKGIVLVDRKTPMNPQRTGLMVLIDLDSYEYIEGRRGKIIASEKTVPERIPPRVKIRENAKLELPHVLVLIDDKEGIINEIHRKRNNYPIIYDFELNMNGGHVTGYHIKDCEQLISRLSDAVLKMPLIVGDGNHSVAAAKVCWEKIKETLSPEEQALHPARYTLVELISIYDKGLAFEPIHRIIYDAEDDFVDEMNRVSYGSGALKIIHGKNEEFIPAPDSPFETIKWVQKFLDDYLENHPETTIDYVHGMTSLKSIIKQKKNAVGIVMPPLARDQLFPYVMNRGVLPRKAFSLGEAIEKRYYLEARIITNERR